MDAQLFERGRKRIKQVFKYLAALNELGNPPVRNIDEQGWKLWARDIPSHPDVERGFPRIRIAKPENPKSDNDEDDGTPPYLLRVRRPTIPPCPKPPAKLAGWLEHGWQSPQESPRAFETLDSTNDKGEVVTIRFDSDPTRPAAFAAWRRQREEWIDQTKPAFSALALFERIYALHGQIQREAEQAELVFGDGLLTWDQAEGRIHHPILLQRVQLTFDANIPEFTIIETDHPAELYTALLRSIPDVDHKAIGQCWTELEEGEFHPTDGASTSGYLRSLVMRLSPHGEFDEGSAPPPASSPYPTIRRQPGFFLRSRSLGLAAALEAVQADLEKCNDIPPSLHRIVGVETGPAIDALSGDDGEAGCLANESETVLLTRPANVEQVRIARRLDRHGCVLVQGPPGTGKTHTIANLVGHLLAQGKSVLVTSHTTKALRVLRRQIVEEIQPLCVSVLESDDEGRRELEASVNAIVKRLSDSDADDLQGEADGLDRSRRQTLVKLREVRDALALARRGEYEEVVVAGRGTQPATAAREVAKGLGTNDWIPGPVHLGSPLPLGIGQIDYLYRTNSLVSEADEKECLGPLPDVNALPTPSEFQDLVAEFAQSKAADKAAGADFWPMDAAGGSQAITELTAVLADMTKAVAPLIGGQGDRWKLEVIAAGTRGGPHVEIWKSLMQIIQTLADRSATAQEQLLAHGPKLSTTEDPVLQLETLREIVAHLEAGGSLGFFALLFRSGWKRLIGVLRVGRTVPTTLVHFKTLALQAELQIARRDLADRWNRQIHALGGPSADKLGQPPERAALQYVEQIRGLLNWSESLWTPLQRRLTSIGFAWDRHLSTVAPQAGPHGDLLRLAYSVSRDLPSIVAARVNRLRYAAAEARIKSILDRLATGSKGAASTITTGLRQAVGACKPKEYETGYARLRQLTQLRDDAQRRRQLLIELEKTARGWAIAIRNRKPPHDQGNPPGDLESAWRWRQFHDELERRSATCQHELQKQAESLVHQLMETTAQLVDRRAWCAQLRRTNLQQRQALMGWLQAVQKIGKGTGKRAPVLRVEARNLMEKSRSAVPVWIMPLARVVESFRPGTNRFDVVIIDEASQSSILELVALYLGKQVVVVGDDQQVSPDAVGQNLDQVQALITEHLVDVPNALLYDGKQSVYDLAMQSFGGVIALREHFRCADEIIHFSNHLCYRGEIRPLRDVSSVSTKPHVIPLRVPGTADDKVNEREALTIASLIAAASRREEYAGKTFGVVSLVGVEQALKIEAILRTQLSTTEIQARRLLCGNAAQFQGDERDIVFLSMVDSPDEGPLAMRSESRFTKRFNVAASRARDQMWVVYSLNHETDVKPGDLRRRLIEHALDPLAIAREIDKVQGRAESEFERLVLGLLVGKGFRVIPQYKVGYYRIDIVVVGQGGQLAIECDGDRFHPLEKLPDDIARQAVLERMGWRFVRIRGTQFFRKPEKAMEPVWAKLEQLGIAPAPAPAGDPTARSAGIEQLLRDAEAIRTDWESETATD